MSPYVWREGRRIETVELNTSPVLKSRKSFQPEWVKLPRRWVEVLRQSKSIGTYQLAHIILFEAFKREQIGGEIVLSSAMTGMSQTTRRRAAKELAELGLIQIEKRRGRQALRVVSLIYY
jgi:hypothetical protein